MRHLALAALAALTFAGAASAHDFFLLPERFVAPRTGTVPIQATVGSHFPTPEIAVTPDRVERVFVDGAGKPQLRVAGTGTKALDLQVVGARPGLVVAAVRTLPREVDYAEDRIPLILGEYRFLPPAVAAVEALARPRNWQVNSRRFAKTFVCVTRCTGRAAADRAFGAPLEFVGSRSDARQFRLLGNGAALANYPVDLVGADGKRQHLSTDARGRVHLPAGARGTMMLFASKLEPPAGKGRFTLDLTSLTFSQN